MAYNAAITKVLSGLPGRFTVKIVETGAGNADEAGPIAPLGEAVELDEHGGMGIVPPVQNCSLRDRRLLGIPAKEVEERLDIRRLSSSGRGYQE